MAKQTKQTKKEEQKLVDGFVVDEQGLVEMRLKIEFEEDLSIKVSPAVAQRIMDGEFDDADPGDCDAELNINTDDLVNLRMSISDVYEGRPPRGSITGDPKDFEALDEEIRKVEESMLRDDEEQKE